MISYIYIIYIYIYIIHLKYMYWWRYLIAPFMLLWPAPRNCPDCYRDWMISCPMREKRRSNDERHDWDLTRLSPFQSGRKRTKLIHYNGSSLNDYLSPSPNARHIFRRGGRGHILNVRCVVPIQGSDNALAMRSRIFIGLGWLLLPRINTL